MSQSIPKVLGRLRSWVDHPLYNAAWFQVTWFACVLGREVWLPLSVFLLILHGLSLRSPAAEARQLLPLALIGFGADTVLSLAGVFEFSTSIPPTWLFILWLAFAVAIPRSFKFFHSRLVLAAVLGGIVVPLNYLIGAELGAVAIPLGTSATLSVLIPVWAMLFPSLCWLAARQYVPVTQVEVTES